MIYLGSEKSAKDYECEISLASGEAEKVIF